MIYPTLERQKIGLIVLMSIVMLVSCASWQTKVEDATKGAVKCMNNCMSNCPLKNVRICFQACLVACTPQAIEEIMEPKETACYMCNDQGSWQCNNQTLICPNCHPVTAAVGVIENLQLPGWAPSLWQGMKAKYYGPLFQVEPWLLVIHSGSRAPSVAEFFHNVGYVKAKNGRKIKVSTQLAWSSKIDDFVQCLPLNTVAWHAGGSKFEGKRKLNFQSIGIELPGPYDKSRLVEKEKIVRCVEGLCNMLPSLTTIVRHSDIDSKKKDPGRGFHEEWLAFSGLDMPFA